MYTGISLNVIVVLKIHSPCGTSGSKTTQHNAQPYYNSPVVIAELE